MLTRPVDPPTFPLRAAFLRHQGLLLPTLQAGLPVGLVKPVAIGDNAERGMPFLFDQLVFLDQDCPLPDRIAIQGFVMSLVSHSFASR